MNAAEIEWRDPPDYGRRKKWAWFTDALLERQGVWAICPFSEGIARHLTNTDKERRFECVTRRVSPATIEVFMRSKPAAPVSGESQ